MCSGDSFQSLVAMECSPKFCCFLRRMAPLTALSLGWFVIAVYKASPGLLRASVVAPTGFEPVFERGHVFAALFNRFRAHLTRKKRRQRKNSLILTARG